MKFFPNFRSCYRPTGVNPPPQDEPATRPITITTTTTTQQVPFSKPKNLRGLKSASATHWRPALSVIAEDVVVPLMESTKTEKKKSSSTKTSSMTKSRSCNYGDEYSSRKSSVPMIIPAFSPIPFMF